MKNTPSITIDSTGITIRPEAGGIWLTQHQIADLFGVFIAKIGSNIRSILKSGVLQEDMVSHRKDNEDGTTLTLYNLEMITALAFRLRSRQAEQFRQWIVNRAVSPLIFWKIPGMNVMLN